MNDEKIINAFKQANFWGNNNLYFSGAILPTIGDYLAFGVFANMNLSYIAINKNENGIGIIPIDQISNKLLIDKILIITNENIKNVSLNNAGFLWYKEISIISKNNELIKFKVQKKVLTIKKHKDNLQNFINLYS